MGSATAVRNTGRRLSSILGRRSTRGDRGGEFRLILRRSSINLFDLLRRQLCPISARACCSTCSLVVFSQSTSSSRIPNRRSRSSSAAMSASACRSDDLFGPPDASPARRFLSACLAARFFDGSDSSTLTYSDGSSTICAKSTARAAARGRRAHQRCRVDGCPWRIDFSRAAAALIASSGSATSIIFLHFPAYAGRCHGASGSPQRIDHGQERKATKVGVAGADLTDAVLTHQHRGVQVVHHVAAQVE